MDIRNSITNHQVHIEKINEANKFFHIDGAYFNIENTNTYKEKRWFSSIHYRNTII